MDEMSRISCEKWTTLRIATTTAPASAAAAHPGSVFAVSVAAAAVSVLLEYNRSCPAKNGVFVHTPSSHTCLSDPAHAVVAVLGDIRNFGETIGVFG
jgi:hypothetical protein